MLAIGCETDEQLKSSVIVCGRKVLTGHVRKQVLTGLITLIAVHYMYELQYNQHSAEIMYFMQEKLIGDPLPTNHKVSQACATLFRSITYIENTLENELEDDDDTEETQAFCELN